MKKLKAVFIEDQASQVDALKARHKDLLAKCGYDVEFYDAKDESSARKTIDTHDPHLLICDLGFDRDYIGLLWIRAIRKDYPDLFVIGTSRGGINSNNIDKRQPSFHMYIDKQGLVAKREDYIRLCQSRFLERFKQETGVRVGNLETVRSDEFKKPAAKRELRALIRQVMFSGHETDKLLHPDEVFLEPLSGGFSGSHVFRMNSTNSVSGINSVPSVLKISKLDFALQELDNYNRFVKWGLPYTWRVDVLGFGTTKTYGAIAYSFILSDLKKFENLTNLFRQKEDKRANNVISKLFSPDMRRWYGDPVIRSQENLVERYSKRYFRGTESVGTSEEVFNNAVQEFFEARLFPNHLEVGSESFSLPAPRLFAQPMGPYQSCICHGDLNGDNVMVAENDEIIFIDFQETGRGHVFEDFVTMEASVRLYHGEEGLKGPLLLKAEQAIREGDDVAGLQGSQLIAANIRRLARQNFPSEPFANYYYANAAYNFRLLRIEKLTSGQKERVVAAVLAGLANLAQTSHSAPIGASLGPVEM
jgi:Phosphotransferase enzyme family